MAITAQQIVDRMKQKVGPGWKDSPVDTFLTGKPDSDVKGVVTTFAPSMEVLRKAVASGKNMIVSRESPYWARAAAQSRPGTGGFGPPPAGIDPGGGAGGGRGRGQANMDGDPTYRAKRDYIAANNLIIYRFFNNWNARQPDPQLQALTKALGWEKFRTANNGFFEIPPATLKATAQNIKKR